MSELTQCQKDDTQDSHLSVRHIHGLHVQTDCRSRGGDPGGTVGYTLTFHNSAAAEVALHVQLERTGLDVMPAELSATTVRVEPDQTMTVDLSVRIPAGLPQGARENQVIKVCPSGEPKVRDTLVFTTVRRMRSPFLIHTAEGWAEVAANVDAHPWMAEILRTIEGRLVDWQVPEVDPSGDFVFNADACRPIHEVAAAWKLTGKPVYAERLRTFLLRLSDPLVGYPATGKGAARYAVKVNCIDEEV